MTAQGVKQALVLTVIEWSLNGIRRKSVSAEEMT
jgi:hypothetical protein